MESKITTFIFDCFGVICDPLLLKWFKEKSEKHGFVDNDWQNVCRQFDLGIFSEDDIFDRFSKYKGITAVKEEIKIEIDSTLKLDHSLLNIVAKLKQRKFKIALLSNANHSFFDRKIYPTYPEFKTLFDKIVISSEVGMVKPDRDIFLHTLEKIKSKPEECLFIDDSKPNVDAAIALGMRGYLYTDSMSFASYLKEKGINLSSN